MNFQEIERYEAAGRSALKEYGMEQWRFELLHCSENATFLVTEPEHEKDGLAAGGGLVSDARKRVMRVARPGYHTLEELESEIRWVEKIWEEKLVPVARPGEKPVRGWSDSIGIVLLCYVRVHTGSRT